MHHGPGGVVGLHLGRVDAAVEAAQGLLPILPPDLVSSDGSPVPEVDLEVRRAEQPNITVRALTSYPELEVRPDPAWGENFCFGDLDSGRWFLVATRSGYVMTMPFTVEVGRTNWVTMPVPW